MNDFMNDSDSTDLVPQTNALVEVEKSRAVQEVQGMMIIAKKFPRDINASYTRIMKSCERLGLAERAIYNFPKGGAVVSGASIRLAEVMAQNWGNIDFGIRELERKPGASVAESYCWDIETNSRQSKIFEVPHEIGLKGGKKKLLTDPRDIYEIVANMGARRLRACILGIIPKDVEDAAVEQCKKTMEKGGGKTLVERIRDMIVAFEKIGVSQAMLEKNLGHKMDLTIAREIVDLTAIYTSIRDGHVSRGEFFDFPKEQDVQGEKASELSEKMKAASQPIVVDKPKVSKNKDPESFDNFSSGPLK